MHRGLLIRQVFTVLDVALVLAFAFVAYVLLTRVFDRVAVDTNSGDTTIEPSAVSFYKLGPKEQYAALADSGLFGSAGATSGAAPPPEPAKIDETEIETALTLKLWGLTALAPGDPLSSAIIEDTARKKKDTFFVGDVVKDRATLLEVRPNEVVLLNNGKRELLRLDDGRKGSVKVASSRSTPTPGERPLPPNTVAVKRAEIQDALMTNAETLMQVTPIIVEDEAGNPTGITAENISSLPLADKLGLQDGDELQQINGQKIDSIEKISEVLTKFGDLDTHRLAIMRNGQRVNLNIKLESE